MITRLIHGGAQENTLLSAEAQVRRGHRVTLITGCTSPPDDELLPWAQSICDVRVLPDMGRAVRPWHDVMACVQLRRLLRELSPDVIHTHSSKAGILGRLAARPRPRRKPSLASQSVVVRCPLATSAVVHTIHGMSFNRTQPSVVRQLYRSLEWLCAQRCDALVCVCDAMRTQSLAAGVGVAEQYHVVHSGMVTRPWLDAGDGTATSLAARRDLRRAWLERAGSPGADPDEVLLVGSVARLFQHKGHDDLVQLLSYRRATGRLMANELHVWIGGGPREQVLRGMLVREGLAPFVLFVGHIAPERMPPAMAALDVLVHTSRWEGLPRVLPQALLSGVPVMAWDLDGNGEVCIDGQTGRLVRPGDVPALSAALDEMLTQRAHRATLAAAGRQLCQDRFDHERMADSLDRIYATCISATRISTAGIKEVTTRAT